MEVLLVDDHPLFRDILAATVAKAFSQAQVSLAGDLQEALAQSARVKFDLVLLDLGLPGCAGIGSLSTYRRKHPRLRVAVVSALEDRGTILAAFKAGAVGYIPKTSGPEIVAAALKVIAAGGTYLPHEIMKGAAVDEGYPELSTRQLEVVRLMLDGLSNRTIAERLSISENTVKHHLSAIFAALGAGSRAEAMAALQRLGFRSAA